MPTTTLTANDDIFLLPNPTADFDDDTIFGGASVDVTVTGAGTVNVNVDAAGTGADSIVASAGDDVIYGGDGNDILNSSFGTNYPSAQVGLLNAGFPIPPNLQDGGDTVYGGSGDDTITSIGPLGDISSIRDTVYGGDGNDSILGNQEQAFDPRVTENPNLDTLYGGNGNDTIDGATGDDLIYGGDGDDLVLARDGLDTTDGGDGIDTIDFSNDSGAVDFDMATGSTTVLGNDPNVITDDTFESNINYENAIGSSLSDTITGNDANNSIDGGDAADTLYGAAGSDTFVTGDGDDSVEGGEDPGDTDIDVLDYSGEAAPVVVIYDGDESGIASGTSTDTDTFIEIESIVLTDQADAVNANNDTVGINVDAGAGNDFVAAGQGADSMDGGADVDELSYFNSADAVTVDVAAGTATGGDGTGDTFVNFESFSLSGGDDSLTGSDNDDTVDGLAGSDSIATGAGDDTVVAGPGNDTVEGGAGADSMAGGAGNDTLSYADDTTGVNVNLDAQTASGGDAEGDTFGGFENLTGGSGDDSLFGDSAANTIVGGDGADSINSDDGDDSVSAGAGNDTVAGSGGDDTLDGGADIDTYDASDATGPVTIDLGADTATGAGIGNDIATNFEFAVGGDGDDTITGDGGDNSLDGGANDDTVDGGGGNDTVEGGDGNDTTTGGSGDDTVYGGDGADTVIGNDGIDTLYGGDGDDDLIIDAGDSAFGGAGDDEFILRAPDISGPGTITVTGGEADEEDIVDPTNNPDDGTGTNRIGDTLVIETDPGGSFDILYAGGDDEAGTVNILDAGGNTISTVSFTEVENIVCFTRGTMIQTPNGEVAIEDLSEGDMVLTRDNGAQAIRWIGAQEVRAKGKRAPVVIKAGALGNDRDLRVSQLHRMLVADWRAELMFEEPEVLVAAKHLANGDTIFVEDNPDGVVEYFHMLFDNHEIVTANGAPSESFHPGQQGVGWLAEEVREEIFDLFPQLREDVQSYGDAARMSLKAYEAKALKR